FITIFKKEKKGMNGQKKPMDQKDDQDKRPPMRLDKKTILVWLVIIISAIFLSSLFTGKGKKEVLIFLIDLVITRDR
ncbi:hypothetical protein MYX77_14190, partial [Acidobacteriia bacterium AH_259_A11_L15]|nr:hypothetical protein [Acidobacteriia bacterium AH_259_A11_L15]